MDQPSRMVSAGEMAVMDQAMDTFLDQVLPLVSLTYPNLDPPALQLAVISYVVQTMVKRANQPGGPGAGSAIRGVGLGVGAVIAQTPRHFHAVLVDCFTEGLNTGLDAAASAINGPPSRPDA